MKLVAELNELGEPDLPGHEAHRAAVTSEENRQLRVGHEPVKFAQLLINQIDRNLLIIESCSLCAFTLIATQILSQQLIKLHVAVVGRVKIDDDVPFVAVSVRELDATFGRCLIVWAPNDVLAVAFVRMLLNRLVERR